MNQPIWGQQEFNFDAPLQTELKAQTTSKNVGLFVSCLVDLFRPVIGFAAAKLLEDAGFHLHIPQGQSCCGQPGHSCGDERDARIQARQVIKTFEGFDYIVTPTPSCAFMLSHTYPHLLADDDGWFRRAQRVASKSHELTDFLFNFATHRSTKALFHGSVSYFSQTNSKASSSFLRTMSLPQAAIELILNIDGLKSCNIALDKLSQLEMGSATRPDPSLQAAYASAIASAEAGTFLSADLGFLLDIAGHLKREGSAVQVRHVAEILAEMSDGPAIGEKQRP